MLDNTTEQEKVEGNGIRARDTDRLTEYPLVAGRQFGRGDARISAKGTSG